MNYPGRGLDVRHPMDCSVMTYHGHSVLRTLMRAYFSPAHTTGQRFIYTGCFDGSIAIFGTPLLLLGGWCWRAFALGLELAFCFGF